MEVDPPQEPFVNFETCVRQKKIWTGRGRTVQYQQVILHLYMICTFDKRWERMTAGISENILSNEVVRSFSLL
jgi:hypothetical protein